MRSLQAQTFGRSEDDGGDWSTRMRQAKFVGQRWAIPVPGAEDAMFAQDWLDGVDQTAYVGARHHTVPRFLRSRWADQAGQVRVYHRVEGRHRVENVRDLAVKDFYTFVDTEGIKNSTVESLLGHIEGQAKRHIDAILDPFRRPTPLGVDTEAVASLIEK